MLQRFGGYALVEANPKTGLHHLVRAHLAHHLLGRLGLHAFKLRFEDPYPEDFSSRLIEV